MKRRGWIVVSRDVLLSALHDLTDPMVLKEEMEKSLKQLLADADIHAEAKVTGPPRGRNFKLVFQGTPGIGAIHVDAVLNYIRNNGDWREINTINDDKKSCKIFAEKDKSKRALATEAAGRRLLLVAKNTFPERDWRLGRRGGRLSIDWIPHCPPRGFPAGSDAAQAELRGCFQI